MIRAGQPSDMAAITRVRTSVRENHLSVDELAARGITPGSIIADMKSGDLGCWVADHDGVIAAFAMANRREGKVWALFTEPQHEGRGHATALLARCEEWLKTQGITEAILDTGRGTRAVAFYMRRGWHVSGYADEDVLMKKTL